MSSSWGLFIFLLLIVVAVSVVVLFLFVKHAREARETEKRLQSCVKGDSTSCAEGS